MHCCESMQSWNPNWRSLIVDTSGGSTLVTSRNPGDLEAFDKAIVDAFS